jgi:hypothetical protein
MAKYLRPCFIFSLVLCASSGTMFGSGSLHNASAPAAAHFAVSSHHSSCFAICSHESHKSIGWLGPLRSGNNADEQVSADVRAHNKANPGHSAEASCL